MLRDMDGAVPVVRGASGWLHYLADFPSKHLREKRTISVWLPPDYDADAAVRYPVFYLHDGQNLFEPATSYSGVAWDAGRTAGRLIDEGEMEPVIMIGVANSPRRLREYGPTTKQQHRHRDRSRKYGRFLVEELKPLVDRMYRTKPQRGHSAVGGSSMGALISLHLCQWYPEVFSKCAALSPSLWWDEERFLRRLPQRSAWLTNVRIWLCMGGREGPARAWAANLRRTRKLAELLCEHGLRAERDYRYVEDPDAEHHESAWAGRFGDVLRFLFPKRRGPN